VATAIDDFVAELPTGAFATDLRLQVTRFTAGTAIVNAVFTQADFVEALAQRAVFVAGAASLRLVANHAHEFFGHGGRLSRFRVSGNRPMVDDLAVSDGWNYFDIDQMGDF
jgi:hypothetical protein